MKTFLSLTALLGLLAFTGCASNRGGTADDFETVSDTGMYESGTATDLREPHPALTRPDRSVGPVIPPP
jgi:hypothetical protein